MMLRRPLVFMLCVVLIVISQGCVSRSITIKSDPPGAQAYLDGKLIGETPVKVPFTDYGTRRIRIEKDGFQTLSKRVEIRPPIYERFPLDFFCEVVLPFKIHDKRVYEFKLAAPELDRKGLMERATEERKFLRKDKSDEDRAPKTLNVKKRPRRVR